MKKHKKIFFLLESFHVLRALPLRTTKNYHYLNKFIFISSHFHLTNFFSVNFFYLNFKPFFATTLHYVDIHSSCDGMNNKLYFHTVHMSLENQVAVFLLLQKIKINIYDMKQPSRTLNILWSYQEMFQEQFDVMLWLNLFLIFYS